VDAVCCPLVDFFFFLFLFNISRQKGVESGVHLAIGTLFSSFFIKQLQANDLIDSEVMADGKLD